MSNSIEIILIRESTDSKDDEIYIDYKDSVIRVEQIDNTSENERTYKINLTTSTLAHYMDCLLISLINDDCPFSSVQFCLPGFPYFIHKVSDLQKKSHLRKNILQICDMIYDSWVENIASDSESESDSGSESESDSESETESETESEPAQENQTEYMKVTTHPCGRRHIIFADGEEGVDEKAEDTPKKED